MESSRINVIRTALNKLVDDMTLPAADTDKNFVARVERLRGVVWYAYVVGDIDKSMHRIFSDRLDDLHEVAITLEPLP